MTYMVKFHGAIPRQRQGFWPSNLPQSSLFLSLSHPPNEAVKAKPCVWQHIPTGTAQLGTRPVGTQLIVGRKSHTSRIWAFQRSQIVLFVSSGFQLASQFHTLEIFWVSTTVFNHNRCILFHDDFLWEKLPWAQSQNPLLALQDPFKMGSLGSNHKRS